MIALNWQVNAQNPYFLCLLSNLHRRNHPEYKKLRSPSQPDSTQDKGLDAWRLDGMRSFGLHQQVQKESGRRCLSVKCYCSEEENVPYHYYTPILSWLFDYITSKRRPMYSVPLDLFSHLSTVQHRSYIAHMIEGWYNQYRSTNIIIVILTAPVLCASKAVLWYLH